MKSLIHFVAGTWRVVWLRRDPKLTSVNEEMSVPVGVAPEHLIYPYLV